MLLVESRVLKRWLPMMQMK